MGFSPAQVDAMTLDQFDACVTGWNKAQGQGPAPEMSNEDYAALCALGDKFNNHAPPQR